MINIDILTEDEMDRLVGFIANDLDGGAYQAMFSEAELEDGAHYAAARDTLKTLYGPELDRIVTAWVKSEYGTPSAADLAVEHPVELSCDPDYVSPLGFRAGSN